MAAGIASGFVRKLYRILDQEHESIVAWDPSGASFSIHDSKRLNDIVLPRYFRGRMSAFRQQLLDHGFEQLECEDNESRECYAHVHFLRGSPDRLSFIVRVPKPKLKAGASLPTATHSMQQHGPTPTTHTRQPSPLGIHLAPTVAGATGRAPLTVTLMTHKRASPVNNAHDDAAQKRLRAMASAPTAASAVHSPPRRPTGTAQAPAPPSNLNRNPLFSNESSTDGLDVARVFSLSRISDSGLFPTSTDLPEPISYLNKLLNGGGASSTTASSQPAAQVSSSSSVGSSTAAPSIDAPVFSEDMMRSALYFLVSGTGVDQPSNGATRPGDDAWATHVQRLSTSGFLSSLMVSSSTGRDTGGSNSGALSSSSVWGPASTNPLFSKSSEQDEEEEDSIWNLLVASSIDRVKSTIQDVVSPQERLRLILEERERLEEQRKRIFGVNADALAQVPATAGGGGGPFKPTETHSAKPLKSVLKKSSPASTPTTKKPLLSAAKPGAAANPLFSKPTSSVASNPLFANDDDDDDDSGVAGGLFSRPSASSASASSAKNPLFTSPVPSAADTTAGSEQRLVPAAASTAEDGLWRLLMTSSVDWFRKGAAEFDDLGV